MLAGWLAGVRADGSEACWERRRFTRRTLRDAVVSRMANTPLAPISLRSVQLSESFERWRGARSMMLRPVLRCSPAIFLSIDYERYESRRGRQAFRKQRLGGEWAQADIVSSCGCAGQASRMQGRARQGLRRDGRKAGGITRRRVSAKRSKDKRRNMPMRRCRRIGVTWRQIGVSPSIEREARYSLNRADGVPPISCVIFATHSSNAGATLFSSTSRGA